MQLRAIEWVRQHRRGHHPERERIRDGDLPNRRPRRRIRVPGWGHLDEAVLAPRSRRFPPADSPMAWNSRHPREFDNGTTSCERTLSRDLRGRHVRLSIVHRLEIRRIPGVPARPGRLEFGVPLRRDETRPQLPMSRPCFRASLRTAGKTVCRSWRLNFPGSTPSRSAAALRSPPHSR